MERHSVETVLRALNAAQVRYLVVGGLAVNAHGYLRYTHDVDLFVDLEEINLRAALSALAGLGYRPSVPVALEDFASPRVRAQWAREKGLLVLALWSEQHRDTPVDLFAEAPFDFAEARAAAELLPLTPGLTVPVVGLAGLLAMKRKAGRPKDLLDAAQLQILQQERERGRTGRP